MRRVHRQIFMQAMLVASIALSVAALRAFPANAATCGDKGFGYVSMGAQSFVAAGSANTNYKIWSRMQGPATSTYLLQVGSTCYEIGGSGLSTSAWTWTDRIDGVSKTVSITGSQTVTLYGTADGVLLDRIIFTQYTDGPCASIAGTNLGDECAAYSGSVANIAPSVTFTVNPLTGTAPLNVNLGVTATDSDGTIASIVLKRGTTTIGPINNNGTLTDTLSTAGTYTYTITVTDDDGAATTKTANVTVNAAPVVKMGDCTNDNKVGLDDLTKLASKWLMQNAVYADCDFDGDKTVDLNDLTILGNKWEI